MSKLILIFIDGLGLGKDDPEINPTLLSTPPLFSNLTSDLKLIEIDTAIFFKDGVMIPVDATLGVPGLPQSATGQTSLFTGVNAAALIGRHLNAFPNETLIKVIKEKSIMKVLAERGIKVTSANLYSKEFFAKREISKKNLFPVSTLTITASGVPFRFLPDYERGEAVYADITNELACLRGLAIEVITPKKAAENMLRIIRNFDFVFFEYFLTDFYGHHQDREKIIAICNNLNRFIGWLWKIVDRNTTNVLIVSDHGNVEDLSTKTHTFNKVPLILLSRDRQAMDLFVSNIRSLTDIYDCVLKFFTE